MYCWQTHADNEGVGAHRRVHAAAARARGGALPVPGHPRRAVPAAAQRAVLQHVLPAPPLRHAALPRLADTRSGLCLIRIESRSIILRLISQKTS